MSLYKEFKLKETFVTGADRVWSVTFLDLEKLVIATNQTDLLLLPEKKSLPTPHQKSIRCLATNSNGSLLAVASFDGLISVHLKKGDRWQCLATLEGHENEVKGVAWGDGFLASCGRDRTLWIWSLVPDEMDGSLEFECVAVLQEHSQDIKCVAWSSPSGLLVTGSYDESIVFYKDQGIYQEDPDWSAVEKLIVGSTVWSLKFSQSSLFACLADGRVLKIEEMQIIKEVRISEHPLYTLAVNETYVASAGQDRSIYILDVNELVILQRIFLAHTSDINSLCWKGDDLVSGSDDGSVTIWTVD